MCCLHLELSYHSSLMLHRNVSTTFKMLIIVSRISQCFIIINTDNILTKAKVFGEYFSLAVIVCFMIKGFVKGTHEVHF